MAIHALTKARFSQFGISRTSATFRLSLASNGGNSLLIFSEIRIKLLTAKQSIMPKADSARGTSGGNISNSHLPGLSPNFIPGISKPRDATACTGKTTFRWPPFCAGRKGKLSRAPDRLPRRARPRRVASRVSFFPGRTFIFIRVCCFHEDDESDKRMQKSVYEKGTRGRRGEKKCGIRLRRDLSSSRNNGASMDKPAISRDRDRLRAEARRKGRGIGEELISFSITVSCLAAHRRFGTTNKSPRPHSLRLAIIRRKWPGRWCGSSSGGRINERKRERRKEG